MRTFKFFSLPAPLFLVLLVSFLLARTALAQGSQAVMNHDDMRMQGGSAPADARDPHAYAGGNTLGSGAYVLGPQRSLFLGDEHKHGMVLVDRLEAVQNDGETSGAYELTARWGGDYDRWVLKAEGELAHGRVDASSTEALWSHAVAPYWDMQLGLRHDTVQGPTRDGRRDWLAFGVQGLAPYWLEVDAMAYLGKGGRTALSFGLEHELLLTQRLVLQPRLEADAYGQRDADQAVGKGLSSITAGLRLRFEFSRQWAPYIGVEWTGLFGETADLARAADEPVRETRAVAGLRFWF